MAAEAESLSSIFPETFTHTPLVHQGQGLGSDVPQGHLFSLRLTRVADSNGHSHPALARVCSAADTTLEVYVLLAAQGSNYPLAAPIALLSSSALRTLATALPHPPPPTSSGSKGGDDGGLGVGLAGRGTVLAVQLALWGEADRCIGDPQVSQSVTQSVSQLAGATLPIPILYPFLCTHFLPPINTPNPSCDPNLA